MLPMRAACGRWQKPFGACIHHGPERRFVVPLGADLPAGTYRLRMVLEDGPELYLALSRTTVEASAQRDGAQE